MQMKNNKVSVKELNEYLQNGKLSDSGTFSEVDIVFIAGLFLLYMQQRDNWIKIPQLFNIDESPNSWSHSSYFKQIYDLYDINHDQIFVNFPKAYTSNANPVSRFFAPPIYITNKSIDYFFGTEKSNGRIDKLKEKYIGFFDISDFVDKTYNSYKKSIQDFEEYAEEIQKRLKVIPSVFVFIFIVACKRLAKKEERTFEETKEYIEKIWQFTQNYTNGLHELARNIVEHSGHGENDGQGMITIRAYSGKDSDNEKKEKIKVLETYVFDYGEKGIYETLKRNTGKNKTDNEDDVYTQDFKILDNKENKYTLKDFIEPTDNRKFLLQQFFREMAHYGLISFRDLIVQYEGKIIASSAREDNENKREKPYRFSKNIVTDEDVELHEIKKGTCFYFEISFIPSLFEGNQEMAKEMGNQLEFSALLELKNFELLEYSNIKDEQSDNRKKYLINLMVSDSLKITGSDKIDNREIENVVCKDIIDKLGSPDVDKFGYVCFALDFDGVQISKSNLLRILARISREKLPYFIIYNIECEVFTGLLNDNKQLFAKIKDIKDKMSYIKDKKIETSYWLKDKSILVFTKHEKAQEKDIFYFADFLFGETSKDFNSINAIVSNTFPNTTYINKDKEYEIDDDFSIPQIIQKHYFYCNTNYLLPFDTLLKNKTDKGEEELFLFNIKTILKNDLFIRLPYKAINKIDEYVNNVDGYRIKQTHFKIGNKVHSEDFYYAKRFFQNSFYTTRLAMYFAKKIDKEINNPDMKITLAGYEKYSELILSLIETFLKDIYNYTSVNHFVAQSKGEKMTFLPKDTFDDYLDKCNNCKTIIIVPIAATGSTTKKIETEIGDQYKEKYKKIISNETDSSLFFSYNILLAQDERPEFISIRNDCINHPVIKLPATWYNLKDCQLCYGIETKPLFDTDNSSLTPSLIFGNPIGKKEQKNDVEKYIVEFNSLNFLLSLNYQSIKRNDNHRIYDIDSDIFINDNEKEIIDWLENKVRLDLENKCNLKSTDRVVIVAPCHESNSKFLNLVNKYLFSSAATIIHHQNGVDFEENFSILNEKHLKDINTKIFYVDDSLITGKHFFELFDLIRNVTEITIPVTASILLNDQATPFIHNRAVELSKYYFAFVSFNQPPLLNILNERPLEHEHKRYELLKESTLHDILREHFYLKAQKLIPEKRKRKEKKKKPSLNKRNKHLKMFKVTHNIYDYFAKNQNTYSLTNEEEWKKFVDFVLRLNENNFKINKTGTNIKVLYKVLSQYPFILYNELRTATFKWHKEILEKVITVPVNEDCFDIDKDYDEHEENYGYDKFTTFKFHIRRAAFLGDYQILNINSLKKVLIWFKKIDKYFEQTKNSELSTKNNDKIDPSLFDLNNDEENINNRIENLRDFAVFVLGNYIEMIQKNGWVAYKILRNIEKIDFSMSNLGKQFKYMLTIEFAFVINDFMNMIRKENRIVWRDMYKDQVELYKETDRIVKFFKDRPELLETNKYKLIEELFLDENNNLNNKDAPIVNYLWINQLLYADSIDEEPKINVGYWEEIKEIINKMKGFFPDRNIVQAFFIVTDGRQEPHVLLSEDNSIFNDFKYDLYEIKQLTDLKIDNEKINEEIPIKSLIDFLNGKSDKKENKFETNVEYIFERDKWINLYNKNDDRSFKFMPAECKWLYLMRISELKEGKNDNCEFETQGLLGFYSTEDLSNYILPKQLLMLLRKDMSAFINEHHKNDEFSRLIQQEEKNRYVFRLNHGVSTYKDTVEELIEKCNDTKLKDELYTYLELLLTKLEIISNLSFEKEKDRKAKIAETEKISLNEIKMEFNKYKRILALNVSGVVGFEKDKIDTLVNYNFKEIDDIDLKYDFPKNSLKDIVFELLNNIRKNVCNLSIRFITEENPLCIDISKMTDLFNREYLSVTNNHVVNFDKPNNISVSHGIDSLRELWYFHKLGRIKTYTDKEKQTFTIQIQLTRKANEND